MFTGIVEEVGTVQSADSNRLLIKASGVVETLRPGDSISVNGACLTAVEVAEATFAVELSEETVSRTNLGALKPGEGVNLERALAAGQPMGGHIVQGHVDGRGTVAALAPQGVQHLLTVEAPSYILRYVVEKAFIAVDGISLTVTACDSSSFTVAVIPYTLQHTVLQFRKTGDVVNIEVDILAKYVEKLLQGEVGSQMFQSWIAGLGKPSPPLG